MQNLQFLIDMLTKGRKLHISILDLSGILNTPSTKISFENVIHSKKFCNIAKSTERGYRLCLRCKKLANTKAVAHKKPFCGHCLYGLYEVAMPVIIGESVAAVVYVGNAITEHSKNNTVCLQASISYRKEKNNSRLQYCSYFKSRWSEKICSNKKKIFKDLVFAPKFSLDQKLRSANLLFCIMDAK